MRRSWRFALRFLQGNKQKGESHDASDPAHCCNCLLLVRSRNCRLGRFARQAAGAARRGVLPDVVPAGRADEVHARRRALALILVCRGRKSLPRRARAGSGVRDRNLGHRRHPDWQHFRRQRDAGNCAKSAGVDRPRPGHRREDRARALLHRGGGGVLAQFRRSVAWRAHEVSRGRFRQCGQALPRGRRGADFLCHLPDRDASARRQDFCGDLEAPPPSSRPSSKNTLRIQAWRIISSTATTIRRSRPRG